MAEMGTTTKAHSNLKDNHNNPNNFSNNTNSNNNPTESKSSSPAPSHSSLSHMAAGSIAGTTAKTILQPLDLIKVRLQVQDGNSKNEYKGVFHAIRSIVQNEGVKGLYRGLSANLLSSGVSWGTYFLVYNRFKDAWRYYLTDEQANLNNNVNNNNPNKSEKQRLGPVAHLLCAAGAGSVSITVTNPIVLVKTRLQLQGIVHEPIVSHHQHHIPGVGSVSGSANQSHNPSPIITSPIKKSVHKPYTGTFNAFYRIFTEEGPLTFYRGLGPSLMLVSNGAIQFCVYEEMKKVMSKVMHGDNNLTPSMFFVMGGSAKFMATMITYPLSVTRSRLYQQKENIVTGKMERKYHGLRHVVTSISTNEGPRGFYKGFVAHLMKTTPSSAITFAVYEVVVKMLIKAESTFRTPTPPQL